MSEFWETEAQHAAAQYQAALESRRREREMILQDEDPSHMTPEYRLWKAKETDAASINVMRKHVTELLKMNHRAREIAAAQLRLAKANEDAKADPNRYAMHVREAASKMRVADDIGSMAALLSEARQDTDATRARAFQTAAREALGERLSIPSERRAAHELLRTVSQWERESMSPELLAQQERFDRWDQAARQGLQEVRRLANEVEPGSFMPRTYDREILEITNTNPEHVAPSTDNESLAQKRARLAGVDAKTMDPIFLSARESIDFANTQAMHKLSE